MKEFLYEKGIFYRVNDSFDHIIDIEIERIEEIKKKAINDNFIINEINYVPTIFFNPYVEIQTFV